LKIDADIIVHSEIRQIELSAYVLSVVEPGQRGEKLDLKVDFISKKLGLRAPEMAVI
jgi:hypothetical protein